MGQKRAEHPLPGQFELLNGHDDLPTYRFNTGIEQHTFCRHCGIHAFYVPRSDPENFSVNARWLFDPNKLAPTYPASMILRPPKFNAYYDVMDVKPVDGATWRLEVSGLVSDKRAWALSDLQALPQASIVIQHICVEGWSYIGGWTGVPLRLFLERVGADLRAKYVAFKTAVSGRILGIVGLSMVRRDLSAMASLRLLFVCGMLAVAGAAHAQSATPGGMPPPPGMSLTQSAAMRFPQPVRVGGLLGREVLRPVESQDVLGWVRRVVRDANGQIMVVVDFGGFLGFGSRPIAVPVDAMVLLGQDMEIVAFTPKQLRRPADQPVQC